MTTRLHTFLIATGMGLAGALNPARAADTYTIDPEKSEVTFTILNAPPGSKKQSPVPGKFTKFSGTVVIDADNPSKSSFLVEVLTDSVDTGNKKRDDHLKNQDFFKVKEYPKMTFKSTSVKKNSDGSYQVKGDFTLLKVTKSIDVVVKPTGKNTAATSFQIKRGDYGMDYRIPDTANEVDVAITFVAVVK